jgi:predicted DNA-binding transcriptional regulator AlpA
MGIHETGNRPMVSSVPERGLRAPEVGSFLGVSRSMVWKLYATDRSFPKGAKIGRSRVWLQSEIARWLERRSGK